MSQLTLDNLYEKLSQWRPDDKNHHYAVIDMGSNGIRFSITSMEPPAPRLLPPVYQTRASISLLDALQSSSEGSVFPESTIKTVAKAFTRFCHLASSHNVPSRHILIVATEAVRRAANADQLLEAIGKATGGLEVFVLEPAVETLFGAIMGSRSALGEVKGGSLFLDLGGGSVQMTWVDPSEDRYEVKAAKAGESLPYGAAKLTRIFEEESSKEQKRVIEKLNEDFRHHYDNLSSHFPALKSIRKAHEDDKDAKVDIFMCGGGFRGYGSMLMHNDPISPYPIPSINTYAVPGSYFCKTDKMRRVNEKHKGKIFGMSKKRRHQFRAITTVVDAIVATVPNIGLVTFCGGSNRQGILMMKLPPAVREADPLVMLANIQKEEKPVVDALLRLLQSSLPEETDPKVPTIFNLYLGPVFLREAWDRHGHDGNTNASIVLHHVLARDPNCPGLTHLARAILGLAACSRWGTRLGSVDDQLQKGLCRVVDRHNQDASFWAQYIGAVSSIVATLFPMWPSKADQLSTAIRFDTKVETKKKKKDKIKLTVKIAAKNSKLVDFEDLVDNFEKAMKRDEVKDSREVSVEVKVDS